MGEAEPEKAGVTPEGSDEPDRELREEEEPSTTGGKFPEIPREQIIGRAQDAITDGDGHILEPPD